MRATIFFVLICIVIVWGGLAGYGVVQVCTRAERRDLIESYAREISQLKLWKEDAERLTPWIKIARAGMTDLERLEFEALVERITQRKQK